jgi:primosomal protein N' (replication factor Y)
MDSDSMRNREDYERVLDSFKKGELDILIGTQMIAKGLHFPNVTLVGVINADQGLHIPDFRAPEKTFQLLTQVAGRAGRGEIKGEVIIQTYTPFNPAIQAALNHDYEGFFEEEIEMRHQLMYPPGNHLTAIHIKGKNPEKTEAYAEYIMKIIEPELNDNIQVSPPAPAPIERIKGYYRFMILFRGTKTKKLKERLRQCVIKMKHPADIEIYTDVDAVSLM